MSTPYPESLDAAEALVFWLNEISTDPADPFAKNAVDRFQFYTFSEPQLRDGRYYPHAPEGAAPFVYFEWQTYETAKYEDLRPYVRSQWNGKNQYFAPETCQIVVAGEDGKFGRGGSISQLSDEDRDNAVSFTTQRVGEIDPNE